MQQTQCNPSCSGKYPHASYEQALKILQRPARVARKRKLTVYRCAICGYWHIGAARHWGVK